MTRRHGLTVMAVLALLLVAAPAGAGEQTEDPSENQVREIAKKLRCAVCQNQSVYESNSDLAKDMLQVIRDKVRAGENEQTINRYFYDRYGDYIYLEPVKSGGNWVLWAAPFVALAIGGAALWAAMGRWRRRGREELPPPSQTSAAMHDRIRQELDKMEL